jgi:hypothetical protein
MAAITRRSHAYKIPAGVTLATADDVNGTSDGTQNLDVSGTARVIYAQINNGTAGTAGIDAIKVSRDGGSNWIEDTTLLALASNDVSGTIVASGILNAAGVEPTGAALFKGGPYHGPVTVRCIRDVTVDADSAAWVTGAPTVMAIVVGD